jgi:hypothetical protein
VDLRNELSHCRLAALAESSWREISEAQARIRSQSRKSPERGSLGAHPPADWADCMIEVKAAAEGDRSRQPKGTDHALYGFRSMDLLVARAFPARAAVKQPRPVAVEPGCVPLEVFGRGLHQAPGVDRAADHSVETLRAHVVGTGGDGDLQAAVFSSCPTNSATSCVEPILLAKVTSTRLRSATALPPHVGAMHSPVNAPRCGGVRVEGPGRVRTNGERSAGSPSGCVRADRCLCRAARIGRYCPLSRCQRRV